MRKPGRSNVEGVPPDELITAKPFKSLRNAARDISKIQYSLVITPDQFGEESSSPTYQEDIAWLRGIVGKDVYISEGSHYLLSFVNQDFIIRVWKTSENSINAKAQCIWQAPEYEREAWLHEQCKRWEVEDEEAFAKTYAWKLDEIAEASDKKGRLRGWFFSENEKTSSYELAPTVTLVFDEAIVVYDRKWEKVKEDVIFDTV